MASALSQASSALKDLASTAKQQAVSIHELSDDERYESEEAKKEVSRHAHVENHAP